MHARRHPFESKNDNGGTSKESRTLTSLVPYRLYATYNNGTTTSIVKAQKQTINGTTYPATLEMLCDEGGAENTAVSIPNSSSYSIPAYGSQIVASGLNTHSVMITNNSASISNLKIVLNGTQEIDAPPSGSAIISSTFPGVYTSIAFKNTSGSAIGLDMTQWSMSCMQSNGGGAGFTLSATGTEIKGDTAIVGNFIQRGGTIEFSGPTDTQYSPASPALFRVPIVSTYQVVAPIINGTASVNTPYLTASAISAGLITANSIYTNSTNISALETRNISIMASGNYPSNPHIGDILLWV